MNLDILLKQLSWAWKTTSTSTMLSATGQVCFWFAWSLSRDFRFQPPLVFDTVDHSILLRGQPTWACLAMTMSGSSRISTDVPNVLWWTNQAPILILYLLSTCRWNPPSARCHIYAYDTQLYVVFDPRDVSSFLALHACSTEIIAWMVRNIFMLNGGQILCSEHLPASWKHTSSHELWGTSLHQRSHPGWVWPLMQKCPSQLMWETLSAANKCIWGTLGGEGTTSIIPHSWRWWWRL